VRSGIPRTENIDNGSKLSIRANTISYEYKGRIFYFSGEDSTRTFIANPTEFTKGVFSIPK
jgi:YHS domain-containing protein